MDQQLIDRIYECSFLPELWPGVLDELARIAEAGGGTFFTVNSHTGIIRWTGIVTLIWTGAPGECRPKWQNENIS